MRAEEVERLLDAVERVTAGQLAVNIVQCGDVVDYEAKHDAQAAYAAGVMTGTPLLPSYRHARQTLVS